MSSAYGQGSTSSAEVEAQLVRMTGAADPRDALGRLGLLPEPAEEFVLLSDGWVPGGAETYVLPWHLQTADERRSYIFKACISIARPIAETIAVWRDRYVRAVEYGVPCATWVADGDGTVLQKFVPEEYWKVLDRSTGQARTALVASLATLLHALDDAGFVPGLFHDLRSNGLDCVLVDLGSDLGGYDPSRPVGAADRLLAGCARLTPGERKRFAAMEQRGSNPIADIL